MTRHLKIFISALVALFAAPAAATAAAAAEEAPRAVHYSGEWTKKSFNSSGTWEIYEENGSTFVKLSADFRTRNAPDLKIFLSPLAASDANNKNATDGAVLISPLSSNRGEQIYEIPADVDLSAFQSILIHCERFSKLWSAADIA
ncbi:MAG: DM13 domain-containing protein [Pseudomonadota bacterium]